MDTPLPAAVSPELTGYHRIILLTDGYSTPFLAKTAISLLRYRTDDIAAVLEKESDAKDADSLFGIGGDIPLVKSVDDIDDADAVFIGIAPPGGKLPEAWRPIIERAIERKLDIVSGLHDFLVEDPYYLQLAERNGVSLIDVRRNRFKSTAVNYSFRRECIRIHSVGHDCTIGKMVTTLEVQRALQRQGFDAEFLATGQTGIMISGKGIPIDCVVADFVNGAAEQLVRDNEQNDFVLIEGQGSISHPAYSAVTLGLLHGSAPDGLIFCYEAGRDMVKGFDGAQIPPLQTLLEVYQQLANLRHPCRVIGVAVNTRNLSADEAVSEIERAEKEFGLPTCDVYRDGPSKLCRAAIELRKEVLV